MRGKACSPVDWEAGSFAMSRFHALLQRGDASIPASSDQNPSPRGLFPRLTAALRMLNQVTLWTVADPEELLFRRPILPSRAVFRNQGDSRHFDEKRACP
jgi:hypothetical protein